MSKPDFQHLPEQRRHQWWFFDPRYAGKLTTSAFKWELLRRSQVYDQLWRDGVSLTKGLPQPLAAMAAEWQKSPLHTLALFSQLNPGKRWIDLTAMQHSAAEFESILPSLDAASEASVVRIGVAEIKIDSGQRKKVSNLWMSGDALRTGGFTNDPDFQKIPLGKWVVVLFDAYASYDSLGEEFDTNLKGQFGIASGGAKYFEDTDASRHPVRLLPATFAADVACLVPVGYNEHGVRAHFLKAVHRSRRPMWLPRFEALWKKNARKAGIQMRRKPKRVRSGFSKYRWIALASYDLNPLRMNDAETRFLSGEFLIAHKTGTPMSDPKRRRRTYNKLHALQGDISSVLRDLEKVAKMHPR